jgi:tRNA (guanine37-N1)-methyltransferase
MKIDILTLFPALFSNFLTESMIGIAVNNRAIDVKVTNIRDFAHDKHKTTDDYPYGGGAGMIMKPEPIFEAVQAAKTAKNTPVIYFTPQGRLLDQDLVNEYCKSEKIILLCGHYKEIDQRVRELVVTDEISIGDYVLSGGEIPAMVFIDAVARLQEGVLSDIDSAMSDSHQKYLLGCPHYTRPPEFKGLTVPEVLLSGNHARIAEWRLERAREITQKIRPDLYKKFIENEKKK